MYARCVFLSVFLCRYLGLGTSGQVPWERAVLVSQVMYARCVFCVCVFLCRYLGLGTSGDGQKCCDTGLCIPGVCACVYFCVFLCRYLGVGTSGDGQKCCDARLCMPGVCVFVCGFV